MGAPARTTAVIGCGKVGFAYLEWLAAQDFTVLGLDPDTGVRTRIRARFGGKAVASDYGDLLACEAVHICIPTEPAPDQSADLSVLEDVAQELVPVAEDAPALRVISQRSTCPPGTADRIAALFKSGVSYGVNPSFLRKAAITQDTEAPERIALGGSADYVDYMRELYHAQTAPQFVSESRSLVEFLKYTENTMDALLDRFGDRPKFSAAVRVPGKAFGLWCLPKDLAALRSALAAAGCPSSVLDGTGATNDYIASRTGVGAESSIQLLSTEGGHIQLSPQGRTQVLAARKKLRDDGQARNVA